LIVTALQRRDESVAAPAARDLGTEQPTWLIVATLKGRDDRMTTQGAEPA
jgi:hypothetical protein